MFLCFRVRLPNSALRRPVTRNWLNTWRTANITRWSRERTRRRRSEVHHVCPKPLSVLRSFIYLLLCPPNIYSQSQRRKVSFYLLRPATYQQEVARRIKMDYYQLFPQIALIDQSWCSVMDKSPLSSGRVQTKEHKSFWTLKWIQTSFFRPQRLSDLLQTVCSMWLYRLNISAVTSVWNDEDVCTEVLLKWNNSRFDQQWLYSCVCSWTWWN